MPLPVMDGQSDGEDEVEHQDRRGEEVEGREPAGVILVALRFSHGAGPFSHAKDGLKSKSASQRTRRNREGTERTQTPGSGDTEMIHRKMEADSNKRVGSKAWR